MKKGFTLIELLAVLVVLAAIIAIITPVISGLVTKSKNSIYKSDIKMYAESIKKAILAYEMEYKVMPTELSQVKEFMENDGNEVSCDTVIIYDRDNVYLEKCTVDGKEVKDYTYGPPPVCTLVEGNPKEIGSKYQCKVKDDMEEGFEDGYYFYVLSSNDDGTYNLIMDRNVYYDASTNTRGLTDTTHSGLVAWINQEDYEIVSDNNWYDWIDNNNYGPITAMNYLNNVTSTWTNLDDLNITYTDEGGNFGAFQITGKARLPYKREVNEIGCEDYSVLSCPVWMVDYLYDAENVYGYWTFSSYADHSDLAWGVFYDGTVYYDGVDYESDLGVRPVINLKL